MSPDEIIIPAKLSEIDISVLSLLITFSVATLCSLCIRYMYINFGRSLNNRIVFSSNFILLALTTAVIITIVKFSFALSLGLVGALSIVRFRNAIREPEELIYLFIIISIGVASGANQYIAAILFTLFLTLFIYFFSKYEAKKNSLGYMNCNLINISCPKKDFDEVNSVALQIFNKHLNFYALKNYSANKNRVNFSYTISNNLKTEKIFIKEIDKLSSGSITIDLFSNISVAE